MIRKSQVEISIENLSNMEDPIGDYGYRFGGVIYHSNNKKPLRKKQRELAVMHGYALSEFRESYPIMNVDKPTFKSLAKDYETKFLT